MHLPLWILRYINSQLYFVATQIREFALSIAYNGSTKLFPTLSSELHTTSMNPEVSKVLSVARWNLKPTYFTHMAKTCTYKYIIYLMHLHIYTQTGRSWFRTTCQTSKTLKVIPKEDLVSWHGSLAETRKNFAIKCARCRLANQSTYDQMFAVLIHHVVAVDSPYLLSIGSKIKHYEQIKTWIHGLIYTWTIISSKTPTYATCKTL